MRLNYSELFEGFFFGLSAFLLTGWFALLQAVLCAFLWAYSGSGASKLYRRLGCGACLFVPAYFVTHSFDFLYGTALAFGALSLGYGIPSMGISQEDGELEMDEGSAIGRFYYRIFRRSDQADVFTRVTVGAALSVSLLPAWQTAQSTVLVGWFMIFVGKILSMFGPKGELEL